MILGILQARTSSSRLPGKVLRPILGQPMILRQIERLRQAKKIDRLMVATSSDPSDDPIEQLCRENKIDCFRGSLDDVLDRFYQAARAAKADSVVRITADCPLIDPSVVDKTISLFLASQADYASNTTELTFPDGLDVEVFRFSALERTWKEAKRPSEREHVTPYLRDPGHGFKIENLKNDRNLSHLRWTVDEPVDFELINAVYQALYPLNPHFSTSDIVLWLEKHPEYRRLNEHIERNEGLKKSLEKEARDHPRRKGNL